MATSNKFTPGSDVSAEEIFTYPFFTEETSKEFIQNHKKIMFIVRGPPGTAKGSLTDLMLYHFPTAVKCSADDYFIKTFNSPVRTKDSLKQSHFHCQQRVEFECKKRSHPVVVSNTHVKKVEFQPYLNLAAKYEYTVIITSTPDKFKVSPEILAKSNTKGLNKDYFANRLRAWQDVFPILMGWFLCPDDSLFILSHLKCAIGASKDGEFCSKVFNAFYEDAGYEAKTLLCCIAAFMKNSPFELKDYDKSDVVRDSCGKSFTISIQAYLFTKSHIFAIVQLDDDLKNLTFDFNFANASDVDQDDDGIDDVINSLQSMSLNNSYNFKLISLNDEISQKPQTAVLEERSVGNLNIKSSSFIHLAQKEKKAVSTWELNKLYRKSFAGTVKDGELIAEESAKVEGGYVLYRLKDDACVIQLPNILSVKTVFTGLYV